MQGIVGQEIYKVFQINQNNGTPKNDSNNDVKSISFKPEVNAIK